MGRFVEVVLLQTKDFCFKNMKRYQTCVCVYGLKAERAKKEAEGESDKESFNAFASLPRTLPNQELNHPVPTRGRLPGLRGRQDMAGGHTPSNPVLNIG